MLISKDSGTTLVLSDLALTYVSIEGDWRIKFADHGGLLLQPVQRIHPTASQVTGTFPGKQTSVHIPLDRDFDVERTSGYIAVNAAAQRAVTKFTFYAETDEDYLESSVRVE